MVGEGSPCDLIRHGPNQVRVCSSRYGLGSPTLKSAALPEWILEANLRRTVPFLCVPCCRLTPSDGHLPRRASRTPIHCFGGDSRVPRGRPRGSRTMGRRVTRLVTRRIYGFRGQAVGSLGGANSRSEDTNSPLFPNTSKTRPRVHPERNQFLGLFRGRGSGGWLDKARHGLDIVKQGEPNESGYWC
jgi:hypothetical protein